MREDRNGRMQDGRRVESRTARNEHKALLSRWTPHIIVSDFFMPGFDGLAAFEIARKLSPSTPFLFLSGGAKGRLAAEAIARGATGYIEKGDDATFVAFVLEALRREHP